MENVVFYGSTEVAYVMAVEHSNDGYHVQVFEKFINKVV